MSVNLAIVLLAFCIVYFVAASTFPEKSYSCVEGVCQLNSRGVPGLAHGVCLTTCGTANLWPYPSGDVSISKGFEKVRAEGVSFIYNHMKPSPLLRNIESNFISSLTALLMNTNQIYSVSSALVINVVVDDSSVTVPSLRNDESYSLKVSSTSDQVTVTIHGITIFGARHGLETLSQLISYDYFAKSLVIPSDVSISDKPVFKYRGVMVDVARNFISASKLKETLRAMGYNKMNVLHLHISDTASFPVELISQPNITSYGAYDSQRYYSVADVADLVSYAHAQGVMILPEIDTPAHVSAGWQWGSAAGLGAFTVCADADGAHSDQWASDSLEPPSGQLNIANENVYPILSDVYREIVGLFGADSFHLGGDEVIVGSDEAWAACYNSTALGQPILDYLAARGLSRNDQSSFYALWSNFTKVATGLVQDVYKSSQTSLNKLHIWGGAGSDSSGVTYNLMTQPDLTTTLPPSLFNIQVWDTTEDSVAKALIGQGYDVILSNTDYVYLDCGNAGFTNAGGYWCQPYHEWFHIYQYVSDVARKWRLTADELMHVLGSETLIWTEMVDDQNLSQKLWPRSAALAEALWSNDPSLSKGWYQAAGRMLHWRALMVARGVQAEALQPLWCSQRDPYACTVPGGVPQ